MADDTSTVALEYYKALRAEILERLKMRDQVILGYLAATGALLGYGLEHPDFKPSLVILLPFLAMGAAITITQHQDQIVGLNQYLSLELSPYLRDHERSVVTFDQSDSARQHLLHNLWMNFWSQVLLLCAPAFFGVWINWPYFKAGLSLKESSAILGCVLIVVTMFRLWFSLRFRRRVMMGLQGTQKRHSASVSGS